MEVRPGYKQTDVGVIPEDWDVKHLGDLASVVRGSSPRPAGDPRYFDGRFIPWLTVASLTNIPGEQLLVSETASCLTEEGSRRSRTLPAGTVIVANSGATLGVAKLLDIRCCANDGIAALVQQRAGAKAFVCHYVNTLTQRLREVIASGNGQPNLNTRLIRDIAIPFPRVEEQHAIAEALGEVDALLAGLGRLIAKKRDLKGAAMQMLLTGQARLPGFAGEWETKHLGAVCEITTGRTPSRMVDAFWGRGHPWLSIADLTMRVVSESKEQITDLAASTMTLVPKGTLLMSFKLTIGKLSFAGRDLFTNEAICAFSKLKASAEYLYYALAATDFSAYGKQAVKGATLNKESLRAIELRLPGRPEQSAIAEVLSAIDAELVALEARRDKTRALKQAMMQELLTGRIRLV